MHKPAPVTAQSPAPHQSPANQSTHPHPPIAHPSLFNPADPGPMPTVILTDRLSQHQQTLTLPPTASIRDLRSLLPSTASILSPEGTPLPDTALLSDLRSDPINLIVEDTAVPPPPSEENSGSREAKEEGESSTASEPLPNMSFLPIEAPSAEVKALGQVDAQMVTQLKAPAPAAEERPEALEMHESLENSRGEAAGQTGQSAPVGQTGQTGQPGQTGQSAPTAADQPSQGETTEVILLGQRRSVQSADLLSVEGRVYYVTERRKRFTLANIQESIQASLQSLLNPQFTIQILLLLFVFYTNNLFLLFLIIVIRGLRMLSRMCVETRVWEGVEGPVGRAVLMFLASLFLIDHSRFYG